MCREKLPPVFVVLNLIGSPLRVQGKEPIKISVPISVRITPACAGKRRYKLHMIFSIKDHPCVCREKLRKIGGVIMTKGSPLRVQGKELVNLSHKLTVRITPACAGKREYEKANAAMLKDHPCVCREK